MIKLKNKKIFSRGGNRLCYIHPDDDNKILKVLIPKKSAVAKRKSAPFYKKFRPLYCFDDNLRELQAYKTLTRKEKFLCKKRNNEEIIWKHIPKCFGKVETDLGLAVCQELIRSNNGNIAISFRDYINTKGFTDELKIALNELCDFFFCNMVITRDLHSHNLVIQEKENGLHIYMVDGIGNSDLIPIANIIPFLGRGKIQRKIDRFMKRLKK